MIRQIFVALLLGVIPVAASASSTFKWTDNEGVVHFTDNYQRVPKSGVKVVKGEDISMSNPAVRERNEKYAAAAAVMEAEEQRRAQIRRAEEEKEEAVRQAKIAQEQKAKAEEEEKKKAAENPEKKRHYGGPNTSGRPVGFAGGGHSGGRGK